MTPLTGHVRGRPIRRHGDWVPGGQAGEGIGVLLMGTGLLLVDMRIF